jgi:hypothetical protein
MERRCDGKQEHVGYRMGKMAWPGPWQEPGQQDILFYFIFISPYSNWYESLKMLHEKRFRFLFYIIMTFALQLTLYYFPTLNNNNNNSNNNNIFSLFSHCYYYYY